MTFIDKFLIGAALPALLSAAGYSAAFHAEASLNARAALHNEMPTAMNALQSICFHLGAIAYDDDVAVTHSRRELH